ncbi:MAG: polyprenyl synthetase family protein [Crocinitomicaceae bacterium]|nr:polyprenyl synthetase family protein [Crocinitomicaceae bacterium]
MQEISAYTAYIEKEIAGLDFPLTPTNLYAPLRYFMQLGGKRMRPILTLLGAELFGEQKEKAINAALSVETFHNFSLIHDDIMDEAPLRRNQATVHQKWNQNIAILSGDVLFVKAFQLLAKHEPHQLANLLELFNKTAIEVCEGQQMDMDFETRSDVTIDEYIEMIRLKTSVLLGCALEMGAIVANASQSDKKLLYTFGQHIGIAFQIQDDILDLYADPEKFGKQVGGDVISNKKTLLNLKAIELASDHQKEQLTLLSSSVDFEKKINETTEIYNAIGARAACEEVMQEHYQIALKALDAIEVTAQQKIPLIKLAESLMLREN